MNYTILKNYLSIEEVNEYLKEGIIKVDGLKKDSEEVFVYCKNGLVLLIYHNQDCCEHVILESADSIDNNDDIYNDCDWCEIEETTESGYLDEYYDESYTWTFYKVKTNKGYDTIRWLGTSNGYYSETVDFALVKIL